MLARASICSVTRMVPSSAAMALPTRPASIVAASTGPSSRTSDMLMIDAQPRFQMQHAELSVALHGQHHADERAGQRHHRQAQHADLVEAGKSVSRRGSRVNSQAIVRSEKMAMSPNAADPIDDQLAQIGNPIANAASKTAAARLLGGLAVDIGLLLAIRDPQARITWRDSWHRAVPTSTAHGGHCRPQIAGILAARRASFAGLKELSRECRSRKLGNLAHRKSQWKARRPYMLLQARRLHGLISWCLPEASPAMHASYSRWLSGSGIAAGGADGVLGRLAERCPRRSTASCRRLP